MKSKALPEGQCSSQAKPVPKTDEVGLRQTFEMKQIQPHCNNAAADFGLSQTYTHCSVMLVDSGQK